MTAFGNLRNTVNCPKLGLLAAGRICQFADQPQMQAVNGQESRGQKQYNRDRHSFLTWPRFGHDRCGGCGDQDKARQHGRKG